MKFELSMNLDILTGAPIPSASWPNTLPQHFLLRGFGHSSQSNAVRSDVDQGPAFQRPRFSIRTEALAAMIVVDSTQLAAFWDWYHNDLAGGALPFTHTHPLTKTTTIMRFDVTNEPQSQVAMT